MDSGSADKHLESEDSRMVELHCETEFCCSGPRHLSHLSVARFPRALLPIVSVALFTIITYAPVHTLDYWRRNIRGRVEVTPAPSAYEISLILFSYCDLPKSLWPLAAPSSFLPNFASSILPVCRLRASGFPGSRRNDSRRVPTP